MAEEEGVEISCNGDSVVNADQTLFRQALNNLISNAIQHTPRSGKISIEVKQGSDNSVDISVSDNVTGLILRNFFREQHTTD